MYLYFEAPDDDDEPTLWYGAHLDDPFPKPVLRRRDLAHTADRAYHWRKIVEAMEAL